MRLLNPNTILEHETRISESVMWDFLRNYHEQRGIQAWADNDIPYYFTNNYRLAFNYASMVLSFIQEWIAKHPEADLSQPFTIIEIGTGSGRFAYTFLRTLEKLQEENPLAIKIKYIMIESI